MERKQEIREKTNDFNIINMTLGFDDLMKDIEQNGEKYLKEVLWFFDQLFKTCIREQEKENKGEINYINIYFLNSSYLLGTYELKIDMYDDKFLADKYPIIGYYAPSFIGKHYEKDWEEYSSFMKKNVIQVKYVELYDFRQDLALRYKKIIHTFFIMFVPYIMRLKTFRDLNRNADIKIAYGEYMCKGIILNSKDEENRI